MLNERIQAEFNHQMNREYYSAYLYLSMSAYCKSLGYMGFAHWLHKQADEELVHAAKFYDYIIDRGGKLSSSKSISRKLTLSPLTGFLNWLSNMRGILLAISMTW